MIVLLWRAFATRFSLGISDQFVNVHFQKQFAREPEAHRSEECVADGIALSHMGGAKLAEEIAMIDVATLAIASEVKGARRRFALENDEQALEIPHGRVFPVRVCGLLRCGSFPPALRLDARR